MARICQVLAGSSLGGGTYVVKKICEGLVEKGHQVSVVSSDPDTGRLFRQLGCRVIDDIPFRHEISPAHDLRALCGLAGRLRAGAFDLVHTHTSKGGALGRAAAFLARTARVIHHVHGFAFDPIFSHPMKVRLYAGIERVAARLCAALIFVNPTDLEWARKLRILRKGKDAFLVFNGVEVEGAEGLPEEETPTANPGALRIGFVGRLAEQKGVDILIEAAAGLRAGRPVEVLIAGDGPARGRLERLAAGTPDPARYQFLGFRPDARRLARRMDVIALPSRWEGHSIALLECMAAGRAVVTTRIKGNTDTVKDGVNGLLVEPGDAAALRGALERLAGDEGLRRRLGGEARRTVAERFPVSKMVREILGIYRQVGVSLD